MTKPKSGSHIGNQHFEFLTMKGAGRNSLTTSETKRFIGICKKILMCGDWNKKVDKEIFYKVISILETASNNADTSCDALPFTLPRELSEDFLISRRAPDF